MSFQLQSSLSYVWYDMKLCFLSFHLKLRHLGVFFPTGRWAASPLNCNRRKHQQFVYDAVSDVVESGVHWRSDFQIGSRVLKICFKPILMHIYGMQYDFMHRSCWNHSNFENSWFYNVISTSDPQNHCLLGSRNRVAVNFFNRYVIYWVVPCERARPELSEYVWQRGVGSLEGRVTAGRSWPFFQEKEEAGVRR